MAEQQKFSGGLGVDRCNCKVLRQASRRISQFYDSKLAPAGLRVTQYSILSILYELQEVSVNELARHMDLDRTTTGKNLRPLERAGFAKVAPSAKDGRSRTITLTAEGLAALKAAAPLWREAQRVFEESNGTETITGLRTTLAQLKFGA
jgi:DNA-binding MarR family transcriptional regulator